MIYIIARRDIADMKKLSTSRLAQVVSSKRKELNLTQRELSEKTGINRSLLSRIEQGNYYPLIPQLEALGDVLEFELEDVFINPEKNRINSPSPLTIAVAPAWLPMHSWLS